MKKSYLLLSSLLLCGCDSKLVLENTASSSSIDSSSIKTCETLLESSSTDSSTSETSSDEKSTPEESSSTIEESSSSSSTKKDVEPFEIDFSGLTDKASIDLANSNNKSYIASFENAFGNVFKSATYYKTFLETYGFRMGSSSDNGELVITLNSNDYTSIDVHAKAYSKYDDYNKIWRTDLDASFKVNGTKFDCVSTEGVESEYTTFTYSQTETLTTITIETVNGRLIIDKITLY